MVELRGTTSGCTAFAASHMTCTNFNFIHIFMLSGSLRKSPYRLMKNALSRSSGSFGVCRMANNSCSTGSTSTSCFPAACGNHRTGSWRTPCPSHLVRSVFAGWPTTPVPQDRLQLRAFRQLVEITVQAHEECLVQVIWFVRCLLVRSVFAGWPTTPVPQGRPFACGRLQLIVDFCIYLKISANVD